MATEDALPDEGLLLTPREAALLSWLVIDGEERLSIEEAASKLDIRPDTARVIISRAKSKLRLYAGQRWPLH
ncbi:hypothetical protein [Actinacidiphila sp. ITFR-21]|uniref:hypothetical protein n=1 Tax=Actinacidiphila sp. ITFR-21 TaxID=3075199 RepID=UPI00288AB4A5|nr:hypothetical protein [Streptomyces sp. ITFR-21]WNI17665.1 hypothetical protein RLT57_20460 [Streptomyces sp. ITFR-21]WNI17805.1 hypothetical protein RLT57_21175 [Streptomyces sp. ITFR-21]